SSRWRNSSSSPTPTTRASGWNAPSSTRCWRLPNPPAAAASNCWRTSARCSNNPVATATTVASHAGGGSRQLSQLQPCGNCDNCLEPPPAWDATEAAQKALSCVYRTGQRFGVGYLIDVLLGKDN